MIKKKENCEYCGEKMESKTAKKRFCSTKCRVYFSRESKTEVSVASESQILGKIKPIEEVLAKKPVNYPKEYKNPEIKLQNSNPEPPAGLTGIDLTIWKAENWK